MDVIFSKQQKKYFNRPIFILGIFFGGQNSAADLANRKIFQQNLGPQKFVGELRHRLHGYNFGLYASF